jgi:hypothetical protein
VVAARAHRARRAYIRGREVDGTMGLSLARAVWFGPPYLLLGLLSRNAGPDIVECIALNRPA